jgi:hypothetical protein
MRYRKLLVWFFFATMLHAYGCAQKSIHKSMQSTTTALINNLKVCDTLNIFRLYDSSFNKLSDTKISSFIKESIANDCRLFRKITKTHEPPKPVKYIYSKDSSTNANIVTVPIITSPDSFLNIESCNLVVIFYPDVFFSTKNNKFIRFYITRNQIKKTTNDKIKLPPTMRNVQNE